MIKSKDRGNYTGNNNKWKPLSDQMFDVEFKLPDGTVHKLNGIPHLKIDDLDYSDDSHSIFNPGELNLTFELR